MQREWFVAVQSPRALALSLMVGRHFRFEIRSVRAGPLLLLVVPPDQFLALAPRLAVWPRRSPVVNDAAIVRPREAPAVPEQPLGLALERLVLAEVRRHPAVDPATRRGRAVVLQLLVFLEQRAFRQIPAVDFLQHLLDDGIRHRTFGRILPGQRV